MFQPNSIKSLLKMRTQYNENSVKKSENAMEKLEPAKEESEEQKQPQKWSCSTAAYKKRSAKI